MKLLKNLNNNFPISSIVKKHQLVVIGLFFSCALGIASGLAPHAFADDLSTSSTVPITGAVDGSSCTPDFTLFAKIKTIQHDPSLSSLDEIKAELAVRKQLLVETITCAQNSSIALKASLVAVTPSQSLVSVQSQLSGQLDEATAYYALELQKVNTAGLSGTEAIALNVLSWRVGTYAPLAENVSNFILYSENQPVFGIAQNRLQQVEGLVGSVPFADNTELQADLQQAIVSLQSAEDENAKVGQGFAQSIPPDQTLALIQQSLADLSATYQHFFDISNLVQTLLPH